LAAVGVVQEDESLELFLDREEDEEARHFLKANNIGDGEFDSRSPSWGTETI